MRANREEKIKLLLQKNAAFDDELFGTAELMPTDVYPEPPFTPEVGLHPRILLRRESIPAIRRVIYESQDKYGGLSKIFLEFADAEDFDGVFPEEGDIIPGPDGEIKNRYNRQMLAIIEAKALAYLLTGDELYGYEAIVGIKNAMLSLRYWTLTNQDTYHGAAHVIDTLTFVYDWCYDLLTERDKQQLIGGVRTKLLSLIEFKYPPSNMGAVSGHGTGLQMFRTYLSLAASFADERPDWWRYVAGRFYSEYLPVARQMYSSGFVYQGPSNYGAGKYYGHLFSALLLKVLGDDVSYGEGIYRSPYTILANFMPNGKVMQTGDANNGVGHLPDGITVWFPDWSFLSAALTLDPTFLKYAKIFSENFTKYSYNNGRMTPSIVAICAASCEDIPADAQTKELDPITHNGFPGGQTIIRGRWEDPDTPMVLMKVGDRTMANHDHQDSGNFQIYYKGLLASDSGWYTGVNYGKPHWKYYQHATVAHNCPLIYDPDAAQSSPLGKYYSGGQLYLREAPLIDIWNGGEFDIAKLLGHKEGRSDDGREGRYAYIAGDLSEAYDKNEVAYVKRSMLSIIREGDRVPLLFFVYDDITSINPRAIKKFLLHTPTEAVVDKESGVTVTENGGGRLTMIPLIGYGKHEAIGGVDKEFWVGEDSEHGYNVEEQVPDKYRGVIWGRAEHSASGNTTDKLLSVLVATDAGVDPELNIAPIDNDDVIGATVDRAAVLFLKSRIRAPRAISFELHGEGRITCYLGGISGGEWELSVNGGEPIKLKVDPSENFAVFETEPGNISLVPQSNPLVYRRKH